MNTTVVIALAEHHMISLFADASLHESTRLSVSDCLRPIWCVLVSGCYALSAHVQQPAVARQLLCSLFSVSICQTRTQSCEAIVAASFPINCLYAKSWSMLFCIALLLPACDLYSARGQQS